jgi:hypothetical protein
MVGVYPQIVDVARASRAFLARVVRHLVGEMGIRQFLDIGTGLPTADNTHEVAQRVAPESRIVYIDNDPMVLAHARALLVGTPEGATTYIDADARNPEKILTAAAETLDFTQPIALVLLGVMGNVADTGEAYAIVSRLVTPRTELGAPRPPSRVPVPPTVRHRRWWAPWAGRHMTSSAGDACSGDGEHMYGEHMYGIPLPGRPVGAPSGCDVCSPVRPTVRHRRWWAPWAGCQ